MDPSAAVSGVTRGLGVVIRVVKSAATAATLAVLPEGVGSGY